VFGPWQFIACRKLRAHGRDGGLGQSMKSINQRVKAGRDLDGIRTEAEALLALQL
jgi:hypothetical protein